MSRTRHSMTSFISAPSGLLQSRRRKKSRGLTCFPLLIKLDVKGARRSHFGRQVAIEKGDTVDVSDTDIRRGYNAFNKDRK